LDLASRHLQHVALVTVVAQVLFGVTGRQVEGSRTADMLALFNDVAHAISSVVPIYAPESTTTFKALSPLDLMDGKFERGALIFIAKDGRELRGLTVQRRDVLVAISVLKGANATFGRGMDRPQR
jgi:hypothetical protein